MQIQTCTKIRMWSSLEIALPAEIRLYSFSGPGNGNHRNRQRIAEVVGETCAALVRSCIWLLRVLNDRKLIVCRVRSAGT